MTQKKHHRRQGTHDRAYIEAERIEKPVTAKPSKSIQATKSKPPKTVEIIDKISGKITMHRDTETRRIRKPEERMENAHEYEVPHRFKTTPSKKERN